VCVKCKKTFCDECASRTEYTGLCVNCELDKQKKFLTYAKQKQISNLSNAVASIVGAILFLIVHFVFADMKMVGLVGCIVLGMSTILFAFMSVDNGVKIKKAKAKIKNLKEYMAKV